MSDIVLRKLTKDDIELVRNWRNSKEVSSYMYTETYITKEGQLKWFNNIDWDKFIYWIIEFNGKSLGLASVNSIDRTLQSCYWAFYLGDTSVRGAGIGAKVEYNVLNFVFEELELNKLRCEVFLHNDKVIKMHEKYGFRREAYYREHCIKENKKYDVVGLAILKSEWKQIRETVKNRIYG
jgi:UDP-4-amino-4,6-dideoxy-N-acetyl-beta-L-altrosamine N-acetyltransferase